MTTGTPADLAVGRPLVDLTVPLPPLDARTHAVLALRRYLSLLTFSRVGARGGPPVTFRVPLEQVLDDFPDNVQDLLYPSIALVATPGEHQEFGLGPPRFVEDTRDKFGQGTVLIYPSDYVERLNVEVWGSSKAELRSICAGLDAALRCWDGSYATALRLDAYYGMIARYWLDGTTYVSEPEAAKGRRRAQLSVWLSVPEVQLVRYVPLTVRVDVHVVPPSTVALEVVPVP